MAEETGPLILTSIEVETATGEQKLKTFEGKVDASAAKVRASLASIDKTGGPLANTLDNASAAATRLGKSADDGLGSLRDLFGKSQADGAAFEARMASIGTTSATAAAETVTGLGAIGLGLGGIAVAAGATAIAVNFALDAASSFAAAAGPITQLSRGFETLTARAGETGDAFLAKMRPATQGLVSDLDLMKATNRALLLDLPVTSQLMAQLAEGAVKLGKAQGVDAARSVEIVIEGLGRQSVATLKQIGVTINAKDAYAAYAKELGTTADRLSDFERRQALTNAALEAMRQNTRGLTEEFQPFSEQWQQATVLTDNARTSILRMADEGLGRAVIAFGEAGAAALEFGGNVVTAGAQAATAIGIFGSVTGPIMEQAKRHTGEFVSILTQLSPPIASAIDLMLRLSSAAKSSLDADAAKKTIHAAAGPTELSPDERRLEGFQEDLDKTSQKLGDLRANAAFLRDQLAVTFNPEKVSLLRNAIQSVDQQIKNMLGGREDDRSQRENERRLRDESRFQEQLLQIAIAGTAKGTEARAALEEAAISVRFNREIASARARDEGTATIEAARDQARRNKRAAIVDDDFKIAIADDQRVTQAHLQNDALRWDQRKSLEERSLSNSFELAVAAADREHRDTTAIFEAYEIAKGGIARRHSAARSRQALDDALALNRLLQDAARTDVEFALQDVEPGPRGPHTTSLQEEIALAEQRKEIRLGGLEALLALEQDALIDALNREIQANEGNDRAQLEAYARYQLAKTNLTRKAELERRSITNATTQVEIDATTLRLLANLRATQQAVSALQGAFAGTKALALALGQINIALAITEVWADPSTSNYYVKIAQSVALAAAGAAQIAQMRNASPGSGSVVSPSSGASASGGGADYSGATRTPASQTNITGTTPVVVGPPREQPEPPAQRPIIAPTHPATPPSQVIVTAPPQGATAPSPVATAPPAPLSVPLATQAPIVAQQTRTTVQEVLRTTERDAPSQGDTFSVTINVSTQDAHSFREFVAGPEIKRALVEAIDQYRSRT